ncbi:MAG: magnesium chelatase domain-containing protein [Dehalococcoidales bacterium]|jgi:magnesium chelatase family protein
MLAKIESRSVLGIESRKVDVEVDITGGLPSFTIVGLADTAVKESRDRVISALKNSGFKFPPKRITINLAPADLRKEGASYDLAIALGILAANGELGQEIAEGMVFCGELSLDGRLRPISGVLPIAMGLAGSGVKGLVIPRGNSREAGLVRGLRVYAAVCLRETVEFLKGNAGIEPVSAEGLCADGATPGPDIDFSDVKGQWHVKRGLEVAAAGGHNVLTMWTQCDGGVRSGGKSALKLLITEIYRM